MFQKVTKELKKNKVLKAGIGYTIGNYFLKGLGFITVPIFSRLMAVSDYGIYNTFLSYEGMLYLFIGLALHSSIKMQSISMVMKGLIALPHQSRYSRL